MFHRFFTIQQLSRSFKIASSVAIVCLLAVLLQHRYLPHATILEKIIEIITHTSFFITALIVISQMLLIFTKNHRALIARYKLVACTIELFFTTLVLWLLAITHHIKIAFITYFSSESIAPVHSIKIMYLLIFIVIMLIIDLYNSIKKDEKINDASIKKILSQETHIFIRQYFILCASLLGLLHFNKLHEFAISSSSYIWSTLILYSDIFGYTIIIVWIIALVYYLYNSYKKYKG